MIHLFIDTTAFDQDPYRRKSGFLTVARLAAESQITIHLSEIVSREFSSHEREKYKKHAESVVAGIRGLSTLFIDDPISKPMNKIKEHIHGAIGLADNSFRNWLNDNNAVVHPIHEHHGQKVVEAYFDGAPPFERVRCRDDFPDAFIWQTITDLLSSVDVLHIVTNDDNLANCLRKLHSVEVHRTLLEFVTSPLFSGRLHHALYVERVRSAIDSESSSLDRLLDEPLRSELCDILSMHSVDGVGDDVAITGTGSPVDLSMKASEAEDLGDGVFVIPFSASVECMMQYYLDGSEFIQCVDEGLLSMGSGDFVNDHSVEVEEERTLRVGGLLSLQVDESAFSADSVEDEKLVKLLESATIAIDEIDEISTNLAAT